VQPVALRYADARHAVSPAALWVGDTTLAAKPVALACGEGLVVHLTCCRRWARPTPTGARWPSTCAMKSARPCV
jgi:hypothetical protein